MNHQTGARGVNKTWQQHQGPIPGKPHNTYGEACAADSFCAGSLNFPGEDLEAVCMLLDSITLPILSSKAA